MKVPGIYTVWECPHNHRKTCVCVSVWAIVLRCSRVRCVCVCVLTWSAMVINKSSLYGTKCCSFSSSFRSAVQAADPASSSPSSSSVTQDNRGALHFMYRSVCVEVSLWLPCVKIHPVPDWGEPGRGVWRPGIGAVRKVQWWRWRRGYTCDYAWSRSGLPTGRRGQRRSSSARLHLLSFCCCAILRQRLQPFQPYLPLNTCLSLSLFTARSLARTLSLFLSFKESVHPSGRVRVLK